MESKKRTNNNFLRKNGHYLALVFMLLSVVAVSVALFVNGSENQGILDNSGDINLQRPAGNSSTATPGDSSSTTPPVEEKPEGGDKPTQTVVSFSLPLQNFTVICDYTEASLVYNKTLNVYTGHLAIDFGAEYGEAVKAVYSGRVESVTTSYLNGTTIVIDHGNSLKTVYNSIDPVEGLMEGVQVESGMIIGFVSDNNRQEYKDGPHLHFEVWENGEKISPYKYLESTEK